MPNHPYDDLEGIDPLHERHYESVETFVTLLRTLGYQVSHDGTDWVEINLDARTHPMEGYVLANYVQMAMSHDLSNAEHLGTSSEDDPLEVTLRWEQQLSLGDSPKRTPLHLQASEPVDYFDKVADVERVVLRYDFDSGGGISLTSVLLHNSLVYVDEMGVEGPLEELEEHLSEVWPKDMPRFKAACESDGHGALKPFWLDYFDYWFNTAQDLADEHVIVHCVGPHHKGYVHDRMYFLMDRQVFNSLEIPPSYRTALN